MRWEFIKRSEDDLRIVYAYAFESRDHDGLISFDKKTKEIFIDKASTNDHGNKWCMNRTIGKFYTHVVEDGFPDEKIVITG